MTFDLAIESLSRTTPNTWRVEPFRRHAVLVNETNSDRGMPLLSLASTGNIQPRIEEGGLGKQAPSESTIERYWICKPGDLVVNPMWLIGGGIGVSQTSGAVSPDYRVYRLGPSLHPRFVHHLLRSSPYRDQYRLYTRADTTFDRRVSKENFHPMPLLIPPLEEQRRIADFLDAETARIDELTALRRRQVALLRERADVALTGLFSQATGSREYRFRHLMRFNPCYGVLVPRFTDDGVPLIRVSDLGRLDNELDRLPRIETDQAVEYRRTRISPGDLLITVVGATIGRCDVAPLETDGFNVSRAIARVQLIPGLSPWLMAAWVRGRQFRIQAELATSGAAAQPALNMSDMAHFTVWLPETTKGRELLAERVSNHEKAVNSLLSAVDAQLSLLTERRQALITAAVTGQFDVTTASGRNVTEGVSA
ncbi:restriction endonuclease subunit S [Streptomyces sp. NPDC059862]|uniref:restriction endonuclease subunit S n=1 Tax=Streptomyces sp. NPDC059862 TaxID=3346975 RepID=UPI003660068E